MSEHFPVVVVGAGHARAPVGDDLGAAADRVGDLLQRVAGYFNIIWDEAEELFFVAGTSDPRVVVDTAGLAPEYTAFANALSRRIRSLAPNVIRDLQQVLEKAEGNG